ncbi:hypothetical protein AB6A40_003478 [Gnathostoma spinigerum]|uniref:F-box domain-containing protein n=1 Tax=Gnathostoma spinigerum TaxID=75299 RepID=A0ABD6E9N9_9BILA
MVTSTVATTSVYLPNEILLEIWKHSTPNSKRKCRMVCRQWKTMIEKYRIPKTSFYWLSVSAHHSKIFLKGGGKTRCIEIPNDINELRKVLSLIEIDSMSPIRTGGYLYLDGALVTPEILRAIKAQKWNLHNLEIFGNPPWLSEYEVWSFVRDQNSNGVSRLKFVTINGYTITC